MNKKNRGTTLFENVVAAILLGIVTTATVFSFASARMWARAAKHHYQAINIARDRIETILAGGSAAAGETPVAIDPATGLNGTLTLSNPEVGVVDVTVSWTEPMWTNRASEETIVFILP